MRGLVYLDRETLQVRWLLYEADELPKGYLILGMHSVVAYAVAEIGGEKFLLPSRSTLRMVTKNMVGRNVTVFGNYRKFTSNANVTFEK